MAGDAPADKRVLAIRSIETKLVMHCMSGDWSRSLERRVQALRAHEFWSCSSLRLLGSMDFFYASLSLCVKKRLYISMWLVICFGGVAASAGYGFSWMAEETRRELQVAELGFR